MAYYAYKQVRDLLPQHVIEAQGPDYEGDANYDGDQWDAAAYYIEELKAQNKALLEACKTFAEWLRREEDGFVKAGLDRSTPEGEAKWREWYYENLRLCGLAQDQARAAIAAAEVKHD